MIPSFLSLLGKLPIEVDINDVPKDPILPKTTKFPPPMLSKMKKDTSNSHLFSQHLPTLPARFKQNSDSRLINYQHKHTRCIKDTVPLKLVQETTLSALALNSEESEPAPPPLPPKPIATQVLKIS